MMTTVRTTCPHCRATIYLHSEAPAHEHGWVRFVQDGVVVEVRCPCGAVPQDVPDKARVAG